MPLRPLSAHRAVLALGSNLGESESTIERAVVDLREAGVRILRVSPLYRTAPVGGPEGQPDYVNAVIEVSTELSPYELLKLCNAVEAAHHRERLVRWGPRTLDIDVIDYEGTVSDDPVLTLPHPRARACLCADAVGAYGSGGAPAGGAQRWGRRNLRAGERCGAFPRPQPDPRGRRRGRNSLYA